jgi:hypothetical protein
LAFWLFQLSEEEYPLRNYRLHVWENERWRFFARTMEGGQSPPEPGDLVVFFYAPTGADEPGFCGWGVVLQWIERAPNDRELCFRPGAPNDFLKMHPWNDEGAIKLANEIRGRMTQRTLWPIEKEQAKKLRNGISTWLGGHAEQIAAGGRPRD